jgi:hypothetical protein
MKRMQVMQNEKTIFSFNNAQAYGKCLFSITSNYLGIVNELSPNKRALKIPLDLRNVRKIPPKFDPILI